MMVSDEDLYGVRHMNFSPVSKMNPLILASSSPRRKRLLTQAGVPFRSLASRIREDGADGDPAHISISLAEEKALRVCSQVDGSWVLGADTVVVIEERILGKPEDAGEARFMLLQLSGKDHRVITGFALIDPSGGIIHSEAISTLVRFKTLTDGEIDAYLSTGEPFGKAGSYAIQGIGSFMVEAISGSYTNVVGLPLCALIKALVSVGAL